MKTMSVREAVTFAFTVAGLLMLDVLVRAVIGGYDAGRIGCFDVVIAITATIYLFTYSRLATIARR